MELLDGSAQRERLIWLTVLVAALGYFVDVVDLWLFSNFRVASLRELGLAADEITNTGAFLLNCQQAGLLIGGLVWGIMGDKRGRASVMFGSIFLYSIGNILNAFVTSVPQYAMLRFVTGFGLAGEIGAGITLVCELLPRAKRGVGTTFVTGLGVAGAVAAALMGKFLAWRTSFLVGGLMGLVLLFMRMATHDSALFERMSAQEGVRKGSLKLLLFESGSLTKFASCVVVGAPIWFGVAIFGTFSPEVAAGLGVLEAVSAPDVLLCISVGMTLGDLAAGGVSQVLKRRKVPLVIFISLTCVCSLLLATGIFHSRQAYMTLSGLVGFFSGYWACLLTTSAEQFGTNIRATATTMIPNLIRATSIPTTIAFVTLKSHFSVQTTMVLLIGVIFCLAYVGLSRLKETFHEDLDYYQ